MSDPCPASDGLHELLALCDEVMTKFADPVYRKDYPAVMAYLEVAGFAINQALELVCDEGVEE